MEPNVRFTRLESVVRTFALGLLVLVALHLQAPQATAQVTGRDYDHDGLTDEREVTIGTLYGIADTDDDLLTDGEEFLTLHTNPLNPDGDGDGYEDGQEIKYIGTNPLLPDTDGDGRSDGQEHFDGTDPLVPDTVAAAPAPAPAPPAGDGNTVPGGGDVDDPNGVRVDHDGDGLYDWDETNVYFTGPANPDTDADGVSDGAEIYYDTDPLDPTDF